MKDDCEDKLPILVDQIQSVMGNFVDSSCGEYVADSDKCDQLPPIPKLMLKTKKSFLYNLVDIFESV